MTTSWDRFEHHSRELTDISHAIKLAHWDQEVMMPPKAGPARARALATLQGIAHARATDPQIGELLNELEHDDSLSETQRASVRIMRRDYDKATKVPEDLVRELAELEATAYQVWTKAKPASDFSMLEPYLTKMLELKKRQADIVGWSGERYDAMLDDYEPGTTAADIQTMFDDLAASLRPLVDAIVGASGTAPAFLGRRFPEREQEEFCHWLVRQLSFDMDGGRLDTSPHPFTLPVGAGDVRQTTRADPGGIMMAIYAAVHETGHALYEQNLPLEMRDLPVGDVPSLGMHESQSRLWENQVGRSRSYVSFLFPRLKEHFPEQLADVDEGTFFSGANHVHRSLIRVTADEVTYNLHVALRFHLELALFRDELEIVDLPSAWNEEMERWIGITPHNDAEGVLQDMHWSMGAWGYFPTYTLGSLYAAAFYDKAEADLGDLDRDLERGDVSRLLAWLDEQVFSRAYMYPAKELGEKILGQPLTAQPFIDYIKRKYGALYDLRL